MHGGLAALDLLIEAEHGPDSSAYLVTHSRRVAEQALAALPEHWAQMTEQRVAFSKAVLTGKPGGIVLTPSIEESYALRQRLRARASGILSADPFMHLGHITEAAEILMGTHTPVSIANFVAGPQCRAADQPLGAHLRAPVGDRFREAQSPSAMSPRRPIRSSPGMRTTWPSTRAFPPTRLPCRRLRETYLGSKS